MQNNMLSYIKWTQHWLDWTFVLALADWQTRTCSAFVINCFLTSLFLLCFVFRSFFLFYPCKREYDAVAIKPRRDMTMWCNSDDDKWILNMATLTNANTNVRVVQITFIAYRMSPNNHTNSESKISYINDHKETIKTWAYRTCKK